MINFRYHVVSLVAVFLALAVGILLGSTVISESVVDQLQRDTRDFARRNDELRKQSGELEAQIEFYERFGSTVVPPLLKNRLAGRSVVLVEQDGAPGEAVERIRDALRVAGVARPARIRLTGAWTLAAEADRDRLALATGSPEREARPLTEQAARALGERLGAAADAKADSDLLQRLAGGGFLRLDDLPAGPFPAPGTIVVVVASGEKGAAPADDAFFLPFLRATAASRTTAVAEAMRAQESLADRVRGDGDLNDVVATVDHADTWPGELSLVVAIRALADGRPAGHYGILGGTDGVAPAIV